MFSIIVRNKRTYKGPGEYIGRPSILGNPFEMKAEKDRDKVIAEYREWFKIQIKENPNFKEELIRLYKIALKQELNLICWCAPKACHGDVIKDWIEATHNFTS